MNTASIIVNSFMALCALAAVGYHIAHSSFRRTMKFFTALSNVFCAVCCLTVAICRMAGDAPRAVLTLKYMGTVAVTLTLMTVLFFLMPQYGARKMFAGADLWLHLICPLLALLSYFAWDHASMPFADMLLGMVPVVLYGLMYLWKVVLCPAEKRWDDFYGFNRNGRWPLSFTGMITGAFLICVLLWAI